MSYNLLVNKGILQLSILHFLRDGFYTSLFLLLPFAVKDLNIDLSHIGILDAVINVLGIIIALGIAYLVKRFGGPFLLSLTLLFYSLSFILLSQAHSFLGLMLSVVILGVGLALFSPIASAIVAKLTKGGTRGKDIGIFIACGDIGKAVFPVGVTLLAVYIGWTTLSLLYGLLAALLFFLYLFVLRKNIPSAAVSEPKESITYKDLIRHKKTLLVVLASTLDSAATSPLFIFLPFLLLEKKIDPSIMGTFVTIFFVGAVLSRILSGRFTDKIGHTNVFIICEVLMVIILVLLNVSFTPSLILLLIPILGLVSEGSDAPVQTMLSESADDHENYEKVFAFDSFFSGIGNVVGPLLIGTVATIFGITTAFYVLAGIIGLAILPVLGYKMQKIRK